MGWHCSGVWNFALQMPNWAEHLKPGNKLNADRQVDIASDYSLHFFFKTMIVDLKLKLLWLKNAIYYCFNKDFI
jgi:hypothetical protein